MYVDISAGWRLDNHDSYVYRASATSRGLFGVPRTYVVESAPMPASVMRESSTETIVRLCQSRVESSHAGLQRELLVDAAFPLGAYVHDLWRLLEAAARMGWGAVQTLWCRD